VIEIYNYVEYVTYMNNTVLVCAILRSAPLCASTTGPRIGPVLSCLQGRCQRQLAEKSGRELGFIPKMYTSVNMPRTGWFWANADKIGPVLAHNGMCTKHGDVINEEFTERSRDLDL